MSGLFNALHLGQSGIFANQKNMSVLGNNVSNANTEGYSRQEVELEPWPTIERNGLSFGQGVKVGEITRAHNVFVTDRLRNAAEEFGQAEGKASPLTELERIVSIDDNSLAGSIDDFFTAWQELSLNPEGDSERNMVLRQADALASTYNQMQTNLDGLQDSIDGRLDSALADVNAKLEEVADLNSRIAQARATGHNPSAALDNRDVLLQELSQKIGAKVYENEKGMASVYLPNGPTLVQDTKAGQLVGAKQGKEQLQFSLQSGSSQVDLQRQDFGGEFRGFLDVRDEVIPEVANQLNELKHDLVVQVNAQHAAGTDRNGETGQAFFEPVNHVLSKGMSAGATSFADSGGDPLHVTVDGSTTDITVDDTDTLGDIRDKINANVDGVVASVVEDGGNFHLKVAATDTDSSIEVNDSSLNGTEELVAGGDTFSEQDGYAALKTALTSPDQVAAGMSDDPGDNENALHIAAFKDAHVAGPSGNSTFVDAYGEISSGVGVEVERNDFSRTSLNDTFEQIQNRRDEIAGVSIDESMIDLQRYQRAFQASAQFVSTIDEMMQTLLSLKR